MSLRLKTIAAFAFAVTVGLSGTVVVHADAASDVKNLATANRADRKLLLKSLSDAGMDAYDALVEGLTHENSAVRADCARLLGALGDAKAIDSLAKRLVKVEGPKTAKKADSGSTADGDVKGEDADKAARTPTEKEQHDDGTVIEHYADGSKKTIRPDGSWEMVAADGVMTTGTKEEKPVVEGETVTEDGSSTGPTPEEIEALKERLKTGEYADEVRAAAVAALVRIARTDEGSREKVAGLVLPLMEAGNGAAVRIEAANGIAALGMAKHADAMAALLTPDGDPTLGLAAVQHLSSQGETGQAKLLAFADKVTEGEGEAAKRVWKFDASAHKGWRAVRLAAVFALAGAKHPEGGRLLVTEAEDNTKANSAAVSRFQHFAKHYGAALAEPVMALLKAEAKKNPHFISPQMEAGLALLAETGAAGVKAMIVLMDEGEAEVKDATPAKANPYNTLFSHALDNTRYGASTTGFIRNEATRAALIEAYNARPEPEGDAKDAVRAKIFDMLLQSKTPESRQFLIEAFKSTTPNTVNQAVDAWISTQPSDDVGPLEAVAKHENVDVRVNLCKKLMDGRVPSSRAVKLLTDMYGDESPKVRKEIWGGLATSEDTAVMDLFDRGMSDADTEVQFAAAASFSTYLNRINTWEKTKKDLRRKAVDMILKHLQAKGGAALRLADQMVNFNTSIWRGETSDGKDEVHEAVRRLAEAPEADLRGVAATQTQYVGNDEWIGKLRTMLLKETEPLAANGQMQGLQVKISTFKDNVSEIEELIEPAVKWLGHEKATDRASQVKWVASNASGLLSSIARHNDQLKLKVIERVRKLMQDELAAKRGGTFPVETSDDGTRRAYALSQAINVLSQNSGPVDVSLVLDLMETFESPATIRSFGQSFLTTHARKEHKARIEGLDVKVLSAAAKQSVISAIDRQKD